MGRSPAVPCGDLRENVTSVERHPRSRPRFAQTCAPALLAETLKVVDPAHAAPSSSGGLPRPQSTRDRTAGASRARPRCFCQLHNLPPAIQYANGRTAGPHSWCRWSTPWRCNQHCDTSMRRQRVVAQATLTHVVWQRDSSRGRVAVQAGHPIVLNYSPSFPLSSSLDAVCGSRLAVNAEEGVQCGAAATMTPKPDAGRGEPPADCTFELLDKRTRLPAPLTSLGCAVTQQSVHKAQWPHAKPAPASLW
jgi:hypothetical protein